MTKVEIVLTIISIISAFIAALLAVILSHVLNSNKKKREDKMIIFKTLMSSRAYGWTNDSVYCLNIIDVVFADEDKVIEAWHSLFKELSKPDNRELTDLEKHSIYQAKCKLLETMANSLGYKSITWETIQNPYVPVGMIQATTQQNEMQGKINEALNILINNNRNA